MLCGLKEKRSGRIGVIDVFNNFFKNKTVLVTGNTGFKGSWLCLWLLDLGANVIGYSLASPTNPSLFQIASLGNKIHQVTADIRDLDTLINVFSSSKPEIIFHLAAQSLVRYSYTNPIETYETNVIGTAKVFEAVKKTDSVRIVVNITSDKCYDNTESMHAYTENDPMGGYDPYSASKGCSELITSSYRNSFFNIGDYGKTHQVALGSVRAGNVIGGGDWAQDRLVPDCVRALSKDQMIYIKNPKSIRP